MNQTAGPLPTDWLFEPLSIGNLTIRNRLVMGAMALLDSHPPGFASDQTRAVHEARAAGGVGLIVTGGTVATRWAWDSAPFAQTLRLDTEETLASLSELAESVHRHGTRIFAQLMQGYGRSGSSRIRGVRSAAASEYALSAPQGLGLPGLNGPVRGEMPRTLGTDEIRQIEEAMGRAALNARRAGFDGVEIPCFVGYLAASFFSPLLNSRTDAYGGSFENRCRFIVNNVRSVRRTVGPDFPIGVRLTCSDHVAGGIVLEDSLALARILVDEGVNYFSLFMGSYEAIEFAASQADGVFAEHGYCQAFKSEFSIPIMVPGLHDPVNAADAVQRDLADFILLTRPLLADAEWANKTRRGEYERINRCDRSNQCVVRLISGLPVRCHRNPELGMERYMAPYVVKEAGGLRNRT